MMGLGGGDLARGEVMSGVLAGGLWRGWLVTRAAAAVCGQADAGGRRGRRRVRAAGERGRFQAVGAGSACSLVNAAASCPAHRHSCARRRIVRRAWLTIRPDW